MPSAITVARKPADPYQGHIKTLTYYTHDWPRRVVSVRAWCTTCDDWDYQGVAAAITHQQARLHVGQVHGVTIATVPGTPDRTTRYYR